MKLNSKIIVFEGIDGSGKTTLVNFLADYLITKGLKAKVITRIENEESEIFYNILQKIDAYNEFIMARTIFRISRLYLRFKEIYKQDYDYYIFDRAILSCLVNSKFDKVKFKIIEPFLSDIVDNFSKSQYFTILLDAKIENCIKRIEERKIIAENEKNNEYLYSCHKYYIQVFKNSSLLGSKYKVDTNCSKEESFKKIKFALKI